MEDIHAMAFKADDPPLNRALKGRLRDDAYDIQIHNVDWTTPGKASFFSINRRCHGNLSHHRP